HRHRPRGRGADRARDVAGTADVALAPARARTVLASAQGTLSAGAPILSVPSRCLICPASAATPRRCRSLTRALSPETAGLAGSLWPLTCAPPGQGRAQA